MIPLFLFHFPFIPMLFSLTILNYTIFPCCFAMRLCLVTCLLFPFSFTCPCYSLPSLRFLFSFPFLPSFGFLLPLFPDTFSRIFFTLVFFVFPLISILRLSFFLCSLVSIVILLFCIVFVLVVRHCLLPVLRLLSLLIQMFLHFCVFQIPLDVLSCVILSCTISHTCRSDTLPSSLARYMRSFCLTAFPLVSFAFTLCLDAGPALTAQEALALAYAHLLTWARVN
jgi:hypothetical protein